MLFLTADYIFSLSSTILFSVFVNIVKKVNLLLYFSSTLFIAEVVLSDGGVLGCIILKGVANILPSCVLKEWTKY